MKPTTYLSNLTPLRGIAALLTVVFHVDLMLGAGMGSLLRHADSSFINRLYLMVDFFFVLSGFVMLHVYGKLFADGVSLDSFRQFTVARFARVYPLHLVMLVFTIAMFAVASAFGIPSDPIVQVENDIFSVFTNLFLLQSMNLHTWFTWVHASWSISTEWWMYMLFPFLVVPFSRLRTPARVLVAGLCFLGYVVIILWIVPIVTIPPEIPFVRLDPAQLSINVAYQYGFLRCLFGFVLGMALYKGFEENWGKSWLGNGYILGLAAMGLFICLHFGVPDVFTVMCYPFILLSAAYGSPRINRLFSTKPLQKIGDWSFSIYLIHEPIMFMIGKINTYFQPVGPGTPAAGPPQPPGMLQSWLICLVFIALVVFLSSLTYHGVEVPARSWINPARRVKS